MWLDTLDCYRVYRNRSARLAGPDFGYGPYPYSHKMGSEWLSVDIQALVRLPRNLVCLQSTSDTANCSCVWFLEGSRCSCSRLAFFVAKTATKVGPDQVKFSSH